MQGRGALHRGLTRIALRCAPSPALVGPAALAIAALAVSGSARLPAVPTRPALAQIRARGTLRVALLNAPTSYYLGADGPQGLEYRLADAFARHLGVGLTVLPAASASAVQRLIASGAADLAAAQISANSRWKLIGLPSQRYASMRQVVVRGPAAVRLGSVAHDLSQLRGTRLIVRAASPQLALLRRLKQHVMPTVSWSTVPSDVDPLARLDDGAADYAVVDADRFDFERYLYPSLSVAFTLPQTRPLQWVARRGAPGLRAAVDRFFVTVRTSGELARLEQQADSESQHFNFLQAQRFQADIARRLPALKPLFEQAAQLTGLDWRLLAAVGYQESRWNEAAQTDAGARGIMMLTPAAAAAVGVTDRGNTKQNIIGGAKYLLQLIDTVPQRIAEPDRTWLALAAYNVGFGHLEDARVLAQMRGLNPDSWRDVRAQLPLLMQQRWYSRLKFGYALGWEPARYVRQIRRYLAVLEWFHPPDTQTAARAGHPDDPSS